MLPTNTSEKHSEYYDYEVMFKKHVHGRMLLNDDLRMLDVMKKSKLKELKRDKDVFISKFAKYNQGKSVRTLPDIHFTGNTTPRSVPKSSFIVCRTSPCSFKAWNNLTDVTKENVDVYKSNVLQTTDALLSFGNTPTHNSDKEEHNADRKSSWLLRKYTSIAGLCSDSVNGKKAEPRTDELRLPNFRQRASTTPSYSRKSKSTVGGKQDVSKHSSKKNECSPTQNCVNSVNSNAGGNIDVNQNVAVSNTGMGIDDSSFDVSVKHTGLNVTFALDEYSIERNSSRRTLPGSGGFVQTREKSTVAQRSHDINPLMLRRRSSSMESTVTEQSISSLAMRQSLSVPKLYL